MSSSEFFRGTTLGLRIAFYGFLGAVVGCAIGFTGAFIEVRLVTLLGYVLTLMSILVGFVGLLVGAAEAPKGIWRNLASMARGARPADANAREYGRPRSVTILCLLGFAGSLGVLATLAVPPLRDYFAGYWTDQSLPLAALQAAGTGIALMGYWRMRRWGVWLMALVLCLGVLLFALGYSSQSVKSLGNLVGSAVIFAIGVANLRRMQ